MVDDLDLPRENNIRDLLKKAKDALDSEKNDIALKNYEKVLHVDPKNIEALTGKGISLYSLGQGRPRIWIDRALKIDSTYVDAIHYKGHILQDSEKYDEAIKCFKKAYDKKKDEKFLKDIGVSFYFNKKLQDAIIWLDKATELDPNYADAWYYKGFSLQDSEKYDEAIKCFKKTYAIDKSYYHSLTHVGQCYYHLGNPEKALELLNDSLENESDDYETLCTKGEIVGIKNYKQGEKFLNKAKNIVKDDSDVWEAMGHLLYIKGNEDGAKRCFRKVLRLQSKRKEKQPKNQKNLIDRLIENPENKKVEIKSSLLFPYQFQGDVNSEAGKCASKTVEEMVLKTIVGFMNTEGGKLIVGMSDKRDPYGLDRDYEILKLNDSSELEKFDKWKLYLENLIHAHIGKNVSSLYVDISRELYKEHGLAMIAVQKSDTPQYLYPDTDRCSFYVRNSGGTRKLNSKDCSEYIQKKFKVQGK